MYDVDNKTKKEIDKMMKDDSEFFLNSETKDTETGVLTFDNFTEENEETTETPKENSIDELDEINRKIDELNKILDENDISDEDRKKIHEEVSRLYLKLSEKISEIKKTNKVFNKIIKQINKKNKKKLKPVQARKRAEERKRKENNEKVRGITNVFTPIDEVPVIKKDDNLDV